MSAEELRGSGLNHDGDESSREDQKTRLLASSRLSVVAAMGVPTPMIDMRMERSEREVKEEVQKRRLHAMHAVTRVRPTMLAILASFQTQPHTTNPHHSPPKYKDARSKRASMCTL